MDKKDIRTHVQTLQSLQRDINFLKKASGDNPSLEKTMDILRNSQDKLYGALAQHGVTSEDVYRVLMENGDKEIIKNIMRLQKNKDTLRQKLSEPKLSPDQTKSLEERLAQATQQHTAAWNEVINSPDKDRIINKIEQAQIKDLQKELARQREQEKDREPERSH